MSTDYDAGQWLTTHRDELYGCIYEGYYQPRIYAAVVNAVEMASLRWRSDHRVLPRARTAMAASEFFSVEIIDVLRLAAGLMPSLPESPHNSRPVGKPQLALYPGIESLCPDAGA